MPSQEYLTKSGLSCGGSQRGGKKKNNYPSATDTKFRTAGDKAPCLETVIRQQHAEEVGKSRRRGEVHLWSSKEREKWKDRDEERGDKKGKNERADMREKGVCVCVCVRQHSECRISADSHHHYSSTEHRPRALKSNPLHLILDFSLLRINAMWTRLL